MAGEVRYRVCPSCRDEFVPTMERCPDCDVPLVHEEELGPEEEAEEMPPVSELACVRVAPVAWIRALSEGLQARGVPHRVQGATARDAPEGKSAAAFGNVGLFGLWVFEEDLPAAEELDGTLAARLVPEEAPELDEDEEERCPACGAALAADTVECPDCGLAFG
ncbi:MAG: hypothetical protein R3263_05255 [Myxococcota bacterium]|nr:hypothetical protein [Myxococcota bacterium]